MHPEIDNWQPARVEDIDGILGGFKEWCLCGGQSIDLLVGRKTREHGDTDIGIFRSNLPDCLASMQPDQVFLCNPLRPWARGPVPPEVHDIWVTDSAREHWILQIMVYDDDGDVVVYRRDPRVRWSKASHSKPAGPIRVLNPAITQLFKCNKHEMQDKDTRDIRILIEESANMSVNRSGTKCRFHK